jgi:phosphatidate cytidylyltransferase
MARSELSQRVAVAAVGIPLVVVVLYLGRWAMGPVLALFCAGAALELYRMAEASGVRPVRPVGMAAAACLVLVAMVLPTPAAAAPALWTLVLVLTLGLSLAVVWARGPRGRPTGTIAITVLGALIPGGAMSYAIFLRHLPVPATAATATAWPALVGVALVAYALAVTWLTDSAAFFAGRRWGRRKLIPSVSPGKTVVGAVAGLGGGLVAGLVMAWPILGLWLGVPIDPLAGAAGGLVIGAISQAGDLAASVWKREAGVKDSGAVFPGHGGIIDRIDSLLFTIPATYWLMLLLIPGGAG